MKHYFDYFGDSNEYDENDAESFAGEKEEEKGRRGGKDG